MKIGLRIPGAAGKLPFPEFCAWCAANGFQAVDIGPVTPATLAALSAAGLEVGTADLPSLGGLFGNDTDAAEAAAAACSAIDTAAAGDLTLGERIRSGLRASVDWLQAFFTNMLVFLAAAAPVLVPLVLLYVVFRLVRRSRHSHSKKDN